MNKILSQRIDTNRVCLKMFTAKIILIFHLMKDLKILSHLASCNFLTASAYVLPFYVTSFPVFPLKIRYLC